MRVKTNFLSKIVLQFFSLTIALTSLSQNVHDLSSSPVDKEELENRTLEYGKIQNWIYNGSRNLAYRKIMSIHAFTESQLDFLTTRKVLELQNLLTQELRRNTWNEEKFTAIFEKNMKEFSVIMSNYSVGDVVKLKKKADLEIEKLATESHHHDKHESSKNTHGTGIPPKAAGDMCTNPDFGLCNFTNWELINGQVDDFYGPFSFVTPSNTTWFSTVNFLGGGIGTQHNITTGGIDPNSGQNMVFPGGSCSALIGDGANVGGNASRIRQTFLVDNSSNIFTLNYHVVLEDAGHLPAEQPYFQIRVFDQNGGLISCASYSAYANDGQPGWTPYGTTVGIVDGYYLPWTTVILPLTSYVGQNVTVEATVGDCSLSGHYGYAYVDFDCQPVTFNVTGTSPCSGPYTLEAPDGGAAYLWSNGQTTQGISVSSLGYYSVNVTPITGGSCTIFLDTTIVGWPQFVTVANLTDPAVCEGEPTTAWIDSSIASYQHTWTLPDGSVYVGHSYSIDTVTLADAGVYQVVTIDQFSGCIDTADVTLSINPLPIVTKSDETICFADSVIISANGAQSYLWDHGLGAGAAHSVSPATTTLYTFVAMGASGCTIEDSLTVFVNDLPIVLAGNDTVICEFQSITLAGQGAQTYLWDQGIQDGVLFYPSQTLTYTVEGTDLNGCKNSDQVTVVYELLPIVSFVGDVLEGCNPLTVNFTNTTPGNLSNCVWNFGDGGTAIGCGTVENIYDQAGTFDVSLTTTSANGCTSSDTYVNYIYVEADPIASFSIVQTEFSTIENVADLVNNSTGAATYLWNFNDGSMASNDVSPTHSFPTNRGGIYPVQLIAYSPLGCPDTTFQSVTVKGIVIYYVPNTFTPDNDEHNNVFYPVISSGIDLEHYTFTIFDRWGEVIFKTNDSKIGWDGTFKGVLVQNGIYNWRMDLKLVENDEKIIESGHLNLVR